MNTKRRNGLPYRLLAGLWRRKWFMLLTTLIVVAVVAVVSVTDSLAWAGCYIMLDFESAHDGLTPNGTRFNIYDIKSEALLTEALRLTGLGEAMTWQELAACMVVAPSRTQSVSKRYIATEYKADLYRNDRFGGVSAESMLDVICRLYYQSFIRQSGLNHAQLQADWTLLDDMEYAEIGEYIRSRTGILRQYLQTRIDASAGYESADPALSFRALLGTVETFQTVYIDKLNALVEQSDLYRDARAYESKLTYQRLLIDQSYQLSRAQFATREQALKDYQESLIAIVMVPTYYASNGLYMSRTQSGIDTLTSEAERYSDVSQKQSLKLAKIDASIRSLDQAQRDATANAAAPSQAQAHAVSIAKASALVTDISRQYDALVELVIDADEAYTAYTARDYVSFPKASLSLTDAYGLKTAVIAAAAWIAVMAALFCWLDSRKKARTVQGLALPQGGERK